MHESLALTAKDLRLMFRDKGGFFFAFVLPLVYAVFFGAIFAGIGGGGGTTAIKVAAVDEDATPQSKAFLQRIADAPEFAVVRLDRDAATASVRKGELAAYVAVPRGFGEAQDRLFWGEAPRIEVGIDPSRQAASAMLHGILTKCAFEGTFEIFDNPDMMQERIDTWVAGLSDAEEMNPVTRAALQVFLPALGHLARGMATANESETTEEGAGGMSAWQPLVIDAVSVARERHGPTNAYAVSFPQGIIWGVMGCAAGFAMSLVTERSSGTLVRLRIAPIARWQILAGKAGACFITTVLMMSTIFAAGALAFDVRPSSLLLLAAAIVAVAAAFAGIMLFLSVLGRTEQAASGICWAVLLVMAMLGGGMVPMIFMPPWMSALGSVSPVKWAILAMEGAIWRGFSWGEMLFPCAVLIAVGATCLAIGSRVFRWTQPS